MKFDIAKGIYKKRNKQKIEQQQQKMMSDKGKATGRGDKGGSANSIKKADRGNSIMEKRQGSQGRGGGLGMPPCAPR